jgi:hypothetical protein
MNPRSPKKRKDPIAVPELSSGVISESMAAGGTPAYPVAIPRKTRPKAKSSGVAAKPSTTVATVRPASEGTRTARRPCRSAALPAG